MDDLVNFGIALSLIVGAIAGGAAAIKYFFAGRLFSKRWPCFVDVGPYSFELRYLYALRGPSGRIWLAWTDDVTYTQTDPRVLVRETWRSEFARLFNGSKAPSESDFAAAVQQHLGNGWLVVTNTEAYRLPIMRTIGHCVVHFRVRGEKSPARDG